MASIRREISITAAPDEAWAAIADVGAIHTRLAPGFVVDTRLDDGARMVTFGNGRVVRELIVDVDHEARRLVWSHRAIGRETRRGEAGWHSPVAGWIRRAVISPT